MASLPNTQNHRFCNSGWGYSYPPRRALAVVNLPFSDSHATRSFYEYQALNVAIYYMHCNYLWL